MSWYKVKLSAEEVASGKHQNLQDEFDILFLANGGPQDAAMFSDRLSNSELEVYFSPGARRLAKALIAKYSGVPCENPSGKKPALLVGHANAAGKLF